MEVASRRGDFHDESGHYSSASAIISLSYISNTSTCEPAGDRRSPRAQGTINQALGNKWNGHTKRADLLNSFRRIPFERVQRAAKTIGLVSTPILLEGSRSLFAQLVPCPL